jgi:hypothetical protein
MTDTETESVIENPQEIHGEGRHPYTECCPICAARIEAMAAALNLMFPTIEKMAGMFGAIENAQNTNPMIARLFGFAPTTETKESRREKRRRLAEDSDLMQEEGNDDGGE